MDLHEEGTRSFAGVTPEEKRNEILSRAERLRAPYEKNVALLLAKDGSADPEGYVMDAKQIVRVLETLKNPKIDPYHWPEHFQIPDHIRFVLLDRDGEPFAKDIPQKNFRNPSLFVEALEEFLTVGQIEGV